ncbi:MAG: hypothetical protein COV67_12595 [Nitrospinae bacterium CG11_big_fil_rev_8_21_14_0_20_56_8]|nr:MAG: hypothetical protein COV67_12595 [Nitrospinae bacterium CG11_big_fil_rev_8_21_14_0_20_56_8]
MKAIVSNCTHGGSICTSLLFDPAGRPLGVAKSSTGEGIVNLRQEVDGWKWYNSRTEIKVECEVERDDPDYMLVKIGFIPGRMYSLRDGIINNAEPLFQIVKHYANVWSEYSGRENAPLHGDLALTNAIFVGPQPVFIDWEHFLPSGPPLGFDAVYMLYLSLWFEGWGERFEKHSIEFIGKMLAYLWVRQCLDPSLAVSPLRAIRKIIFDHPAWWGPQAKKLPPLLFSDEAVFHLDRHINTMTRLEDLIGPGK